MAPDDELTPLEREWGRQLQRLAPGHCLEAAELLELAEQGRGSRDYDARMEHVCLCPGCRTLLNELRVLEAMHPERASVRPPEPLAPPGGRRPRWSGWLAAGAAAAAPV